MSFKKTLFLILIIPFVLAACSSNEPQQNDEALNQNVLVSDNSVPDDPLNVITTFPPLYSFTKNIVGNLGEVTNLVPGGVSVHAWEPKASDLRNLTNADLLVMNGLELETFVEDMVDAVGNDSLKVVVTSKTISGLIESSESLELESEESDHENEEHTDEDEHDHQHDGTDPHIWLNPNLAMQQVEAIRDALIEVAPKYEETFRKNTEAYLANLEIMDQQIREEFEGVSFKNFIVFHDAYTYYFDAYNLLEYRKAAVEPFPGKEPGAAYLQNLIKLIEEEDVQVIFTEPQFSPALIEAIIEETGIQSFELDPIGNNLSAEGYYDMIVELTRTLREAFEK